MRPRLCTQCEHYLWCSATFVHKCDRDNTIKYSLVNGASSHTNLKVCQDERYDTGTDLDICGLEGKYYKERSNVIIIDDNGRLS